jgi:hypothetical protein
MINAYKILALAWMAIALYLGFTAPLSNGAMASLILWQLFMVAGSIGEKLEEIQNELRRQNK